MTWQGKANYPLPTTFWRLGDKGAMERKYGTNLTTPSLGV